MPESLNDYPAAFQDNEPPAWETEVMWPAGVDQGKPLSGFSSPVLLRKRAQAERAGWLGMVSAIDEILTERGGE